MKKIIKLIFSVAVCFLASGVGAIFTSSSIDSWYSRINKPSFNPPNWVFAPVWTILFALMGIALFLVWSATPEQNKISVRKNALFIFFIQLILNVFWSVVFFGLRSPFLALGIILILWILILFTITSFLKINKIAAILLIPYLLWVGFAAILNFLIWKIN